MVDYANHPKSIAEVRADRSGLPSDWTPRDALIAMLREIDSGRIRPDALVISYRYHREEGESVVNFFSASPDPLITHGLLAQTFARCSR